MALLPLVIASTFEDGEVGDHKRGKVVLEVFIDSNLHDGYDLIIHLTTMLQCSLCRQSRLRPLSSSQLGNSFKSLTHSPLGL